jgi:methionyl-tRNA formyltransferase
MTDAHRVVLAGNNQAAVYVLDLPLERLAPAAILAIAPPATSATWQVSLDEEARARDVHVIAAEDVNDDATVQEVREHQAGLLLSVFYTQMFRPAFLAAVDGPALNFHPSLLPRHRGHAPLIWAIADGDTVTGLSVHHIDHAVDTGRLVARLPLPIHPDDTGFELHRKMALLVRAAAAHLLRLWLRGVPIPEGGEQSGEPTLHRRSDPALNHVDWTQPRARIRDVVRALAPPLPGAFARYRGMDVILGEVEFADAQTVGHPPGMVEHDSDAYPLVCAGDGLLRLTSVVRDGEVVDSRVLALERGALLR